MNTLLGIFTWAGGGPALLRHWPYFQRQDASTNLVIGTLDRACVCPDYVQEIKIGLDSYINGTHLPMRLCRSIEELLTWDWDVLVLAEYDTLIINRIKVEDLEDTAAHLAGHYANAFYHNPYCFNRATATKFVEEGFKVIESGTCQPGSLYASPDVFFGLVCHRLGIAVQQNLWTEFSRNSLDLEGDLDRARLAYRSGVDCIHGIKTEKELRYITE